MSSILSQTPDVCAQDSSAKNSASSTFRSNTYARLLSRATLPGPGGSIVTTERTLPVVQYVTYWASGVDTIFGEDTASMEVTGWQAADAAGVEAAEADVQTAFLTLRSAPTAPDVWVSLGRQTKAGGAARFARFDGIAAGISPIPELSLRAYGGYRVLPRFDQQPGYHHLGASSDVLMNAPAVLEPLDRNEYSVVGGDMRFDVTHLHAALSFHDETDRGAIGRRNLGFDVAAQPTDKIDLGGALLLDLDALRWSNARLFVDYFATKSWELSGQYVRAEPALLLSRQSVLSVFSTASYQEFGLASRYRLKEHISLSGSAWAQDYDDSGPGARFTGELRAASDSRTARTIVAGYTRVATLDGGYHSVRGALSQQLARQLTGTLQSFLYLYDVPIADKKTSMSHAVTLDYGFSDAWSLLWGASLASSPYANFDAGTQMRLSYALHERGSF